MENKNVWKFENRKEYEIELMNLIEKMKKDERKETEYEILLEEYVNFCSKE